MSRVFAMDRAFFSSSPRNFEVVMVDLTMVPEAAIRRTTLTGMSIGQAQREQERINQHVHDVPSGFVAVVMPGKAKKTFPNLTGNVSADRELGRG